MVNRKTTPVDVFTVLRGLLMLLAAPLLSVGLSYLLGWLFFKIGSRLQNPQHLGTVLSMVILVAFLVYNFSVSGSMGDATAMQAQLDAFPPAAWMMRFIAFGELRALLCVLAVTVLPFALGICLFSAVYGEKQQSFRSKKTGLDFTARTPRRALLRKEARRYFASSVYVVNTIFGLVMMAGGTAALLIFRAKALDFLASAEFFRLILAPLLAMAYSWMASTVYITAASISLEGRSLWILKANPVETRDIFAAKIQLNLLVAAPVTLLCSAVGAFALRLPLADALCVMLLPLLTTLLISVGGLYINLLFPKLDWTEEGAVVKQSMSAMLCFFLGGFFVVVPPVVYLLCFSHVPFLWAALAIAALYLLLTAFFWLRLCGDGSRRFAAL